MTEVVTLLGACCEQVPGRDHEPDRYTLDVARFEFALKARCIPPGDWQEAEAWMREGLLALNYPNAYTGDEED